MSKVHKRRLQKIRDNAAGKDFNFSQNIIHPDGVEELCYALKDNNTIGRVNLDGCGVGDKGCDHMKILLEQNQSIVTLELQRNQITRKGAKQIIKGLQHNNTLQYLYLEGNEIPDADIQAMLATRSTNTLEIILGCGKVYKSVQLEASDAQQQLLHCAGTPSQRPIEGGAALDEAHADSCASSDEDRVQRRRCSVHRKKVVVLDDSAGSDDENQKVPYLPAVSSKQKKSTAVSTDKSKGCAKSALAPSQPASPIQSPPPSPGAHGQRPQAVARLHDAPPAEAPRSEGVSLQQDAPVGAHPVVEDDPIAKIILAAAKGQRRAKAISKDDEEWIVSLFLGDSSSSLRTRLIQVKSTPWSACHFLAILEAAPFFCNLAFLLL
jgi:hypothetical protein